MFESIVIIQAIADTLKQTERTLAQLEKYLKAKTDELDRVIKY